MCNMFQDYDLGANFQCRNQGECRDIFGIVFEEVIELQARHSCTYILANCSSFRSKKENDFIMCCCFCSNLCIVMYRKFRNVPLFKFFSLICSSFWNLKVGKYALTLLYRSQWVVTVPSVIFFPALNSLNFRFIWMRWEHCQLSCKIGQSFWERQDMIMTPTALNIWDDSNPHRHASIFAKHVDWS